MGCRLELVITDRSTARRILRSARKRAPFHYLVSIGAPRERKPAGVRHVPRCLRLVFTDTLSEQDGGPSRRHVERLVEFARGVRLARGRVLVHCQMGISRSSAAAAILLAVKAGPGSEPEVLKSVGAIRPGARPNVRMLELADEVLGTGGALVRALRSLDVEGGEE